MEHNGVFSKGYGIIPKLVMLEGSISIDAKALYAYFCAYAGNGSSCYPPRDKILRDLGFSTATYYGYLRELREGGYLDIKKHKTKGQEWCNSRIILLQNPAILAKAEGKRRRYDITGGLRDYGYGRIPLAVMTDRRISRKAKAMYAYFCSFAGSKGICNPEIEYTLGFLHICLNSYYKYLNELLCYHYVTVMHRKDDKGRYLSNSILLNAEPEHMAGLLALEERRERYLNRLGSGTAKPPRRRRRYQPAAQNPRQITEGFRAQIGFDRLAQVWPENKLNMIVGFITELSFDPYRPVDATKITGEQVADFIGQMERSVTPSTIVRNVASYWKRSFINYLINREAGLIEARA